MCHRMVAAGFENVEKAHQIALYVGLGMVDAVAHPGLGGEIDDDARRIFVKYAVHKRLVGNGTPDEHVLHGGGLRRFFDQLEPVGLQLRVVVIVHVIQADNGAGLHRFKKTQYKIGPNKAGGAGDQDCPAVQIHMGLGHGPFLLNILLTDTKSVHH